MSDTMTRHRGEFHYAPGGPGLHVRTAFSGDLHQGTLDFSYECSESRLSPISHKPFKFANSNVFQYKHLHLRH